MKRITYTRQDFGIYRGDCYETKEELKEAIEGTVREPGGFYSQKRIECNLEPKNGQKRGIVSVPSEEVEKTKEEIEKDIEREVEEAWKKADEEE